MQKYIITGASGGIGQGIIDKLISMGYNQSQIIGMYRKNLPKSCIPYKIDFDDTNQDYSSLFENIDTKDQINFISCAGITINKAFHKYEPNEIRKQFNTNALGVIEVIQQLWLHMKSVKYGRIIFISSVVASRPLFGTFGYCSSKAAIFGMTRSLATEGAKYNICTGNIVSGYADVGMINDAPIEVQEEIKKTSVLGRLLTVDEIFNTIAFFIQTPYATGQTMHLNGGLYYGG